MSTANAQLDPNEKLLWEGLRFSLLNKTDAVNQTDRTEALADCLRPCATCLYNLSCSKNMYNISCNIINDDASFELCDVFSTISLYLSPLVGINLFTIYSRTDSLFI